MVGQHDNGMKRLLPFQHGYATAPDTGTSVRISGLGIILKQSKIENYPLYTDNSALTAANFKKGKYSLEIYISMCFITVFC